MLGFDPPAQAQMDRGDSVTDRVVTPQLLCVARQILCRRYVETNEAERAEPVDDGVHDRGECARHCWLRLLS